MKIDVGYKLLTSYLCKNKENILIRALICRELSINSTASLKNLLCANRSSNLILRKNSKWNPNIVKSAKMDLPIGEGTIVDAIWSRVDQWADKVAMVCGITGREVRYCELQETSRRIGIALLTDLGLSPGQVIAVILPNMLEYPPVVLGAIEAGIVVTPINPIYTSNEIAHQLRDSGAVAAFTLPDKVPTLLDAVSTLDVKDFKMIITPNLDGTSIQQFPDGVLSYQDLIAGKEDSKLFHSLKPKTVSPNDTIYIPFSSGTTGIPKGVCLTHRNLLANNANLHYSGYIYDSTKSHQDVVPMLLPIFHQYGFAVVMINSLFSGAKLVMLPKFEELSFLKSLKEYKANVLYVAPPLVSYIANSNSVTKEHLSSLRTLLSGASNIGESEILRCLNKCSENLKFVQGYGLTETSPAICFPPNSMKINNLNTVGPPVANTMVKVSDVQTQQALGPNEEGEIWVKGPQVMKSYLNNPTATNESIDNDGWFHTGDLGYYDADDLFYITDRIKELIKVKGFQVAPSELEAVLLAHPDVNDVGVIGVPHVQYGEVPVAFINCKVRDKSSVENHLRDHLKTNLAKYKHISEFFFVDSIPKSAAGKILRKELRILYQELAK